MSKKNGTAEVIKLSDLTPDAQNANRGTERGRYLLEQSLRKHGAGRSILLDKHGRIIAGNKTYETAGEIGLEDAVIVRTNGRQLVAVLREDLDLDTPEGKAMAISDNRAGEVGLEWDIDTLVDFAADGLDLGEWWQDFELAEMGVTAASGTEEADAEPQINRAEELREQWQTESGQLWRLPSRTAGQEHRLVCGDCTDAAVVKRVMEGEKAVLFATDPPYGVAYNDETGSGKGDTIANDENDGPRLQAFLESCFRTWLPYLKDNAAWYLWHAQLTQGFFAAAAAAAADILIHRQIIWVKPSLIMGHGDYHWKHELCFYGWRRGNRPPFYGQRNQTTTWEIGRESAGLHPTQKPTALWDAPLSNHTQKGEICAEPFCGSGSQIIAAENLARQCRAIEISPAYTAVCLERYRQAFNIEPELIG